MVENKKREEQQTMLAHYYQVLFPFFGEENLQTFGYRIQTLIVSFILEFALLLNLRRPPSNLPDKSFKRALPLHQGISAKLFSLWGFSIMAVTIEISLLMLLIINKLIIHHTGKPQLLTSIFF